MLIAWLIVFAIIEIYSIGITFLAYQNKEKCYLIYLIPFMSFFYIDKFVKGFNIAIIPTKKWGKLTIILLAVALICTGVTHLGNGYFEEENAMYLFEIMKVPLFACLIILYLGIVCSTFELYKMIEIKANRFLQVLCALTIVGLPILLIVEGVKDGKKN